MENMTATLYGITSKIKEIDALIEQSMEQGIEINLDPNISNELAVILMEKTDAVVGYRQELDDYSDLIKEKIDSLTTLRKRIDAKAEKFDNYVLDCMRVAESSQFTGKISTIKKRKPLQSVEVVDENQIPSNFITVVQTVNISKSEIGKALKSGDQVPGARLVDGKVSVNYKLGK